MENKNVPLSDRTKDIILGSILGDGSLKIYKGYKNARFSFRHSIVQKSYFLWKVKNLSEISSSKSIFLQKPDNGYSKNEKLRYQSMALELLTGIYEMVCKRNIFQIRRKWLNRMSALSLAIWWFDDGSIISNGRKGVFCTDGFEKNQVEILSKYLRVVWDIQNVVAPIRRKRDGKQKEYWRIWIRSTNELKKFFQIILPHLEVEELLPKVIILYKDLQLQQRWISEIAKSTKFSEEIIQKYVSGKKNKWKAYRK